MTRQTSRAHARSGLLIQVARFNLYIFILCIQAVATHDRFSATRP